ncbi:U11/U12 small nuclear ribonucleoprotein 25 kDa protein [Phtheirospermum japonicum]|uniref:U11/U12 small nuclear ribonucleoprotein 25 kDa protein n=1 Tax=Phtheirospermum japonicum TaxID=374723 RepID=A0A830CA72_9LAMI|nr:U11/U12 small nuclear ribonucleoprotein 25 kDa protein [Phtheirospermum japonicum]
MVKVLPETKIKNRPTNILKPFRLYNKSFTYRKLPEQLLKLSVLKLDGSNFGIHVARNATVARLKSAIEEEFNISCKDEMKELWSLVWSHFCLCYEGQKLVSEKACIRKYGIKDGDQLEFVRYLRIDQVPTPEHSKNQNVEPKHCLVRNAGDASVDITIEDQSAELEYNLDDGDHDLALLVSKSKPTKHSLKELLSCSRFRRSKPKAIQ